MGKPWDNAGKMVGSCGLLVVFHGILWDVPSGKGLHNYGKSPLIVGNISISTGPCSIAMLNCERVGQSMFQEILFAHDGQ